MRRRHAAHNPARLDQEDVLKAVDQKPLRRQTHGLALVRVDKPLPPDCGLSQWVTSAWLESQLAGNVELTPEYRTVCGSLAIPDGNLTNFFQTTS